MDDLPGDVTRALQRIAAGEREAYRTLLPLVYGELKQLAARALVHEASGHTLQTTALVHEAYLRLMRKDRPAWADRKHFLRASGIVMRTLLVNHARDQRRQKRGGGARHVTWSESLVAGGAGEDGQAPIDVLALDEALAQLAELDARQAEIVELRFFAGLTIDETADVLGVSSGTVQADWRLARAWLFQRLGDEDRGTAGDAR